MPIETKDESLSYDKIYEIKQPSNFIYNFILKIHEYDATKYYMAWKRKCESQTMNEDVYYKLFRYLYALTDDIKLRNFQYRLLLGKIFVNDILCKWKIVETAKCEWCGCQKQKIVHLLVECLKVKAIWNFVRAHLLDTEANWSLENILNNTIHYKPMHVYNLITLQVKYYKFQQKCLGKEPNAIQWLTLLKELNRVEISNSVYKYRPELVKEKWHPVQNILNMLEFR